MASAILPDQTGHGYTPPANTQFSVFLDNRVGKLLELLDIFSEKKPRIIGLSIMDSTEYAVVRILTNDAASARTLLDARGMSYSETQMLAVRLGEGHEIADLCRSLLAAELSLEYAYSLMVPRKNALALHTDNSLFACEVLLRKKFELLGEADFA